MSSLSLIDCCVLVTKLENISSPQNFWPEVLGKLDDSLLGQVFQDTVAVFYFPPEAKGRLLALYIPKLLQINPPVFH